MSTSFSKAMMIHNRHNLRNNLMIATANAAISSNITANTASPLSICRMYCHLKQSQIGEKTSITSMRQIFFHEIQQQECHGTRLYSSSSSSYSNNCNNDSNLTGFDHHKLYQEQMKELEQERNELFGTDDSINDNSNEDNYNHDDLQKSIEEINQEREELYNFTNEEKQAWGNLSSERSKDGDNNKLGVHSPELMDAIQKAREAKALYEDELRRETSSKVDEIIQELDKTNKDDDMNDATNTDESNKIFTHLNKSGEEVSMVDVGDKTVSKRIAVARSSVLFPPEVMDVFGLVNNNNENSTRERNANEMVGPKGPIFATARLAGIMGAKRTSDLIPLCHPLPLSKVHIDIQLEGNRAIIECECRVTHKTGVEMEALAGASVAALTIYDMVKAVSHNVVIESTFLVKKSGGKRDVEKSQ